MHTSEIIKDLSTHNGRVALVVVIEAKGSAPRHPGSRMLVLPEGRIIGTIGGGAVEAQAIQQAVSCIAKGEGSIFKADMLGERALGTEPICGGSVSAAILLVDDKRAFEKAAALLDRGERVVMASSLVDTLVDTGACGGGDSGGVSALIAATGQLVYGSLDQPDEAALREAFETGLPVVSARDGRLYDPLVPRDTLLIFGGGHVGQALAQLAVHLDFQVLVADSRPEYVESGRFPLGVETRCGGYYDLIHELPAGPSTYAVVVSPSHSSDLECVRALLKRDYRYTGFIGSRRKVRMILDQAVSEGFPAERVNALRAPIGMDIGAETPAEIAVAILAELIAARREAPALAAMDAARESRRA